MFHTIQAYKLDDNNFDQINTLASISAQELSLTNNDRSFDIDTQISRLFKLFTKGCNIYVVAQDEKIVGYILGQIRGQAGHPNGTYTIEQCIMDSECQNDNTVTALLDCLIQDRKGLNDGVIVETLSTENDGRRLEAMKRNNFTIEEISGGDSDLLYAENILRDTDEKGQEIFST